MITVYGFPDTRSKRITWLLEEMQIEYVFSLVNFRKGTNRSDAFLALNPAGKIPVIQDGDLAMTESGAICTYLADKYGTGDFIPAVGTPERAMHEQWNYFVISELEQPLWTIAKHKFGIPAEYRVSDVLPTAEWEFQQALTVFSLGLGDKPYILGEQMQAADILLAQTLSWGMAFKQPIEQDNLIAYADRMLNREAFNKVTEQERHVLDEDS